MRTNWGAIVAAILMVVSVMAVGTAGANPDPTVTVGDAQVKAGGEASVTVTLDEVPNGLNKYNVTISLADGSVADVKSVQDGDLSVSVESKTADSVTFRASDLGFAIGSGDGPVDLGTVTFNNTADGSSAIDVTVNVMTNDNGNDINPSTQSGTLTVTDVASVTFGNQTSFGDSVTVDEVFAPNGGFVAVYEQNADGSLGDRLGHSSFLNAGTTQDVQVSLDPALAVEGTLIAKVYNDTDGDEAFDPNTDSAYTDDAGSAITDSATISLHYGAAQLKDGGSYWQGRDLHRASGVDANETLEIRTSDGSLVQNVTDDDGNAAVTFDTAGLSAGSYVLEDSNGNTIASFDVTVQSLSASFDNDTVKNSGTTTVDLSVDSNRDGYAIEITSSGLSNDDLETIFDAANPTVHDGTVVVTGVSSTDTLTADFDGISKGNYSITLSVTDSTASASASITVESVTTTTVKVVIDGAPNGIRKYSVNVSGPTDSSIQSVTGKINFGKFQINDGGENHSFVVAREVSFSGGADSFTGTKTLFTVEFKGNLSESDIDTTVLALTDKNGTEMNKSRIGIEVAAGAVFTSPIPGTGAENAPTDPDSDGLYEDVNGDGEATFADAVSLAFAETSGLSPSQIAALDFDGDNDVDFDDAVALAFNIP